MATAIFETSPCLENAITPAMVLAASNEGNLSRRGRRGNCTQFEGEVYSYQQQANESHLTFFHNEKVGSELLKSSEGKSEFTLPKRIAINTRTRTISTVLFEDEAQLVHSIMHDTIQPHVISQQDRQSRPATLNGQSQEQFESFCDIDLESSAIQKVIKNSPEGKFTDQDVYRAICASCLAYRSYEIALEQGLAEIGFDDDGLDLARLGLRKDELEDSISGLHAKLFYDLAAQRYVLAYRGTTDLTDWKTNVLQGVGKPTAHYQKAMATAEKVNQCVKARGEELIFTGHSLGGGLAYAASATTDCYAITFNAAGVRDKTIGEKGEWNPRLRVLAYHVKGEPLTLLQDKTKNLKAGGVRVSLQSDWNSKIKKHSSNEFLLLLKNKAGLTETTR